MEISYFILRLRDCIDLVIHKQISNNKNYIKDL